MFWVFFFDMFWECVFGECVFEMCFWDMLCVYFVKYCVFLMCSFMVLYISCILLYVYIYKNDSKIYLYFDFFIMNTFHSTMSSTAATISPFFTDEFLKNFDKAVASVVIKEKSATITYEFVHKLIDAQEFIRLQALKNMFPNEFKSLPRKKKETEKTEETEADASEKSE